MHRISRSLVLALGIVLLLAAVGVRVWVVGRSPAAAEQRLVPHLVSPDDSALQSAEAQATSRAAWAFLLEASPDGHWVAIGGYDKVEIFTIDPATNSPIPTRRWTLALGQNIAGHLAFSRDSNYLAVSSSPDLLQLWDVRTGALRWRLQLPDQVPGHRFGVSAVEFGPSGRWVAIAYTLGYVEVREVASGRLERTFGETETPVRSLAFSVDEATLVAVSENQAPLHRAEIILGALHRWRLADGALLDSYLVSWSGTLLSPDGTLLLHNWLGLPKLLELSDGPGGQRYSLPKFGTRSWRSVDFSDDGRVLIGTDGMADIMWADLRPGAPPSVRTLSTSWGPIKAVAVPANASYVVTMMDDGQLAFWHADQFLAL